MPKFLLNKSPILGIVLLLYLVQHFGITVFTSDRHSLPGSLFKLATMEKVVIPHSLKDIPIPDKRSFLLAFTAKVDNLIERMRWKVFWNNQESESTAPRNYGFKTQRKPPPDKLLTPFETELQNMVNTLRFNPFVSQYQQQLLKLVEEINESDKVYVKADKTNNLYRMDTQMHNKLLMQTVTKTYKRWTFRSTIRRRKST